VVIIDKEAHASIVDGCRLAAGTMRRFQHNDMDHLERLLSACAPDAGRLVIVDGVYSMGGDLAPLPRVVELCQRYQARLLVDDAHALGVLGDGRGTAAHFGLTEQVDLIGGTFSKSLASLGGFVAGEPAIIDYIRHMARSFIFSASIPAAQAAAALVALRILRAEPQRIRRLHQHAEQVRCALHALGYHIGQSTTAIVPVTIGEQSRAARMWQALFEIGIFVNVVVPPAVASGRAGLRTSYMATHTDAQIQYIIDAFTQLQPVARAISTHA
jgi:7-keto-8-aminopelargonate synthetase-like enzyme